MGNAALAVSGRLGSEPRDHTTFRGSMATASVAVDVEDRTRGAEKGATKTLWITIIAFGRVADELALHERGDPVAVSGRLQWSSWTDQAGDQHEQLQILADALISARTVRGGRRKAKPAGGGQGDQGRGAGGEGAADGGGAAPGGGDGLPFDDPIPF